MTITDPSSISALSTVGGKIATAFPALTNWVIIASELQEA